MKTYILLLIFLISSIATAQNNHIVKTDDGRRVLLKADYTWEYIDAEKAMVSSEEKNTNCNLSENFTEPVLNKKIQAQLKKGRATIDHIKRKVAKDNNCEKDDVILMSVSEQKTKATYRFCANGKDVSYKRIGNSIIKKEKLF